MSMNKAIESKKEYRKAYYGAKAIDKTCRNHGLCPYYSSNRKYKNTKKLLAVSCKLTEWKE